MSFYFGRNSFAKIVTQFWVPIDTLLLAHRRLRSYHRSVEFIERIVYIMATFHFNVKPGKVGSAEAHCEYINREGRYASGKRKEELGLLRRLPSAPRR